MDKSTITRDGNYAWDSDMIKACSEIYSKTTESIWEAHLRPYDGSMDKMLIWNYVSSKDLADNVAVSFPEMLEALSLSRSTLQRKLSELVGAEILEVTTQPTSGQSLYRIGSRGIQENVAVSQEIHLHMLEYGLEYAKIRGLTVEECINSVKDNLAGKIGHQGR